MMNPGQVLSGKLHVLELLDGGGSGEVYAAWHDALDREVAVKILRRQFVDDPKAIGRFRHSGQERPRPAPHERYARVIEAGEESGCPYLVMDLVSGVSLAECLRRRGRLPWYVACDYARQAALALQHLHAQGLSHGNVGPANLMVDMKGAVTLLDWGLGRFDVALDCTMSAVDGVSVGALDIVVDANGDLDGLGGTLYYLITGRAPFAEQASDDNGPLPPVHKEFRSVPSEVDAVIARLTARRSTDRFANAGEAATALQAVLAGIPFTVNRSFWRRTLSAIFPIFQ
jgi:serine/threonine-protein kinase